MIKYNSHKWGTQIRITLWVMTIFIISMASPTFAANHSDNHTYSSSSLKQLIDVRVEHDDYNITETQQMIDRIGHIPEKMIAQITGSGGTFILMDFPLTDLSEFASYKGTIPRGWEETGLTWDDVPGAGGLTSAARIGYSNPGNGHSTINLELHEFSHALDSFLKDGVLSESNEFKTIHQEEKENLFPGEAYFDHVEEYFAESMALFYLGGEYQAKLGEKAPKTYRFIQQLDKAFGGSGGEVEVVIPEVPNPPEEITADLDHFDIVTLGWEHVDGADYYIVLRHGKEIDTTKETTYTDKGLDEESDYDYTIQAVNGEGPSDASEIITIQTEENPNKTKPKPNAPKQVVTKQTSSSITLTWDQVENVQQYTVLRDGKAIAQTTEPLYTDKNVHEKSTYQYSIIAENEEGTSDTSNTATVTTAHDPNKNTVTEKQHKEDDKKEHSEKEKTESHTDKHAHPDEGLKADDAKEKGKNNTNDSAVKKDSKQDKEEKLKKHHKQKKQESVDEEGGKEASDKESTLPPMATQSYRFMFIGMAIMLIGLISIAFVKRRKTK